MVWSPNLNQNSGDAWTPYYPGDDVVDWVGLSVYWKGFKADYPWITTNRAPDNFFAQIIDGLAPEGGDVFFTRNSQRNEGSHLLYLSEGSATKHLTYSRAGEAAVASTQNIDETENQMVFWNSFLFNQTFRTTYPLMKMVNMFEFLKPEGEDDIQKTQVLRDFRTTWNNVTAQAFREQLGRNIEVFQLPNVLNRDSTATSPTLPSFAATATATAVPRTSSLTTVTNAAVTTTTTSDAFTKFGESMTFVIYGYVWCFSLLMLLIG
ncbi:hypothetical protein BC829DRAFT_411748 [Chytridium lagenaria]|nr:hypothetical protein BC829DRAFT_411748 [Chytridium lagenaria]